MLIKTNGLRSLRERERENATNFIEIQIAAASSPTLRGNLINYSLRLKIPHWIWYSPCVI